MLSISVPSPSSSLLPSPTPTRTRTPSSTPMRDRSPLSPVFATQTPMPTPMQMQMQSRPLPTMGTKSPTPSSRTVPTSPTSQPAPIRDRSRPVTVTDLLHVDPYYYDHDYHNNATDEADPLPFPSPSPTSTPPPPSHPCGALPGTMILLRAKSTSPQPTHPIFPHTLDGTDNGHVMKTHRASIPLSNVGAGGAFVGSVGVGAGKQEREGRMSPTLPPHPQYQSHPHNHSHANSHNPCHPQSSTSHPHSPSHSPSHSQSNSQSQSQPHSHSFRLLPSLPLPIKLRSNSRSSNRSVSGSGTGQYQQAPGPGSGPGGGAGVGGSGIGAGAGGRTQSPPMVPTMPAQYAHSGMNGAAAASGGEPADLAVIGDEFIDLGREGDLSGSEVGHGYGSGSAKTLGKRQGIAGYSLSPFAPKSPREASMPPSFNHIPPSPQPPGAHPPLGNETYQNPANLSFTQTQGDHLERRRGSGGSAASGASGSGMTSDSDRERSPGSSVQSHSNSYQLHEAAMGRLGAPIGMGTKGGVSQDGHGQGHKATHSLGFFRRRKRGLSTTPIDTVGISQQAQQGGPISTGALSYKAVPRRSQSPSLVEGYLMEESPPVSGMSESESGFTETVANKARASLSLGRKTKGKGKGNRRSSTSRARQGMDGLRLGIEHALSMGGSGKGGGRTDDEATPIGGKGIEDDEGREGFPFHAPAGIVSETEDSRAVSPVNELEPEQPPSILPPPPQIISKCNSGLLLQGVLSGQYDVDMGHKLVPGEVTLPGIGGKFISPGHSPHIGSSTIPLESSIPTAGLGSASAHHGHREGSSYTEESTMETDETWGNANANSVENRLFTHPPAISTPASAPVTASVTDRFLDDSAEYLGQGGKDSGSNRDSDNVESMPSMHKRKHSRNRTLAILPSDIPGVGLAVGPTSQRIIPPHRVSSREQTSELQPISGPPPAISKLVDSRRGSGAQGSDSERVTRHRRNASSQGKIPSQPSQSELMGPRPPRRPSRAVPDQVADRAGEHSSSDANVVTRDAAPSRSRSRRHMKTKSGDKENRHQAGAGGEEDSLGTRPGLPKSKSSETGRGRRPPDLKHAKSTREREKDAGKLTRRDARGNRQFVLPSAAVKVAPRTGMYWSKLPVCGQAPEQALRSHSATLVGNRIWVIGGSDRTGCYKGVCTLNIESNVWARIPTTGVDLPPLRAHTTTLVGKKLYIIAGGDGNVYNNDVWVLDTVSYVWSRPNIITPKNQWPVQRRAHTTVHYQNFLVIFGGGNGSAALNDVWALDIEDEDSLNWTEWRAVGGELPHQKGYHTANLVGCKMIVYGGSDGSQSFDEIHILNLETMRWTKVEQDLSFQRLSHTSTLCGAYLVCIGGHDGQKYAHDVLLFNLVTLSWERKQYYGELPSGRGYHTSVCCDGRIILLMGYNGHTYFDDVWCLELGANAYLPQIMNFEVNEEQEREGTTEG